VRILVVGFSGVGSAFAPIAARRDFYEHVVFADQRQGPRPQGRRPLRDGRYSAARVDASDAAITSADDCTLIGYDGTADGVTVNVVDGEFQRPEVRCQPCSTLPTRTTPTWATPTSRGPRSGAGWTPTAMS
jgi:hypothetical protein